MCMGGGAKAPAVTPPTPPPAPAMNVDEAMQGARRDQMARAAASGGFQGSIKTSGLGDTTMAATEKKKLGA